MKGFEKSGSKKVRRRFVSSWSLCGKGIYQAFPFSIGETHAHQFAVVGIDARGFRIEAYLGLCHLVLDKCCDCLVGLH